MSLTREFQIENYKKKYKAFDHSIGTADYINLKMVRQHDSVLTKVLFVQYLYTIVTEITPN